MNRLQMGMKVIASACLIILLMACLVNARTPKKEKGPIGAADKWLALVDSGNYAESWTEAAGYFKNIVTQETWVRSLSGVRKPLGKLISRKAKVSQYVTSLPGAPDGEYMVIQFETSFENKRSATETVTPVHEKDGKWRVDGYYIK